MSHPFQSSRADKVSTDRAQKFTKGFASGGAANFGEPADRKSVKGLGSDSAQKVGGKKAKSRPDRLYRAKGGRADKKGKTHINIMVAPQEGAAAKPPMPMPMPVAAPPPGPPPMPPPGMAGPPGLPPGSPPGGPPMPGRPTPLMAGMSGMPTVNAMPLRAKGGRVKVEAASAGTKVQSSPGKNDLDQIKSKPAALVRARGGKVEQDHTFPKMKAGGRGGLGRLEKAAMQKKTYP